MAAQRPQGLSGPQPNRHLCHVFNYLMSPALTRTRPTTNIEAPPPQAASATSGCNYL